VETSGLSDAFMTQDAVDEDIFYFFPKYWSDVGPYSLVFEAKDINYYNDPTGPKTGFCLVTLNVVQANDCPFFTAEDTTQLNIYLDETNIIQTRLAFTD